MSKCVNVDSDDDHSPYNSKTSEYYNCYTEGYAMFCPKTCKVCEEKWRAEYIGLDISIVQLPSYNLTENNDGSFDFNLTNIEPTDTLSTSYLTKLDLNHTKPMDVKREFCLELKAISTKYSEPERIQPYLALVS